MSIFFYPSEVFQFAIRIEKNGEKFYRHAARITKEEDARKIFEYLADEEKSHKKTFEDLLPKIEGFQPLESYPGEYLAYLTAYVDKIIFTDDVMDKEISGIEDPPSAVDFGIQRELDSILYYHELKKFVPESQHRLIDKVIDEERKHFSKLSKLRKKI